MLLSIRNNKEEAFFKNWMPNIIHQGILLNYLQNNLQDGHFIIKIFLVRADFERWHFENYVVGLASSSPTTVPTSPPSHRVPHHQLGRSLFFACPDTDEDTL